MRLLPRVLLSLFLGGIATALSAQTIGTSSHNPCEDVPTVAGTALAVELVADGFHSPVHLTAPPHDLNRLFVIEQAGTIRIIHAGKPLPQPFLDIRDRVLSGGERGLLSLAFHPE